MHVSYSQISMFEKCGYKYWLHYVDPERVRPPKGLWSPLGRAVHHSIKENLRAKMAGGELDHHGLRAAGEFDRLLQEDEYTIPQGEDRMAAIADARSMAVKLAELHAERVAPTVFPYLVEERVEVEIAGAPVVAYIDIAERVDRGGLTVLQVRDTKTQVRKPATDEATRSLQLRLYGYVLRQIEGVTPSFGVLDVLLKATRPVAMQSFAPLTDEDLEVVELHVEALLRAREAGIFPPTSPDSWHCSQAQCEYWEQCPYALRPTSIGVP